MEFEKVLTILLTILIFPKDCTEQNDIQKGKKFWH